MYTSINEFKKHLKGESIKENKVFTFTGYSIPTDDKLSEFEQHKEMTAKDIFEEFCYNIIGKGIKNQKNKEDIITSIKKLCEMYPGDNRYADALSLAENMVVRPIAVNENINVKDLVKDQIYKIYDTKNGGRIKHSCAKYIGHSDKGYEFQIVDTPSKHHVFIENMEDMTVLKNNYFKEKK